MSAAGGVPQPLTALNVQNGEVSHRLPQILPDGQAVIFTVTHLVNPKWDQTKIVLQSLTTGTRKILVAGGAGARYVPTGHLIYVRTGTLMAVPFDLARLEVTGGPMGLVAEVMQSANMRNRVLDSGVGQFSISESGSLLYVPGGMLPDSVRSLVWVDRSGKVTPVSNQRGAYIAPRLAPDDGRIAFSTVGLERHVWVYDVARRTTTRLTTDGRNEDAMWSQDGKRLAFASSTTGYPNLFWQPADGSAAAARLTTSGFLQAPAEWTPDGQTLPFVQSEEESEANDIWMLSLAGDRQARPFLQTRFSERHPALSPDGHWLAYASDLSGHDEVYIQPYPVPGSRTQISTQGGTEPAWSKDGRELFYTIERESAGLKMMAVAVTTRPILTASVPRLLFELPFSFFLNPIRAYDVTADGRFLMIRIEEPFQEVPAQMILVQNWFDELKRRVPAK